MNFSYANSHRPGTRSNKPITQFACDYLDQFLEGKMTDLYDVAGNTQVEARTKLRESYFSVIVRKHEILRVAMLNDEPISLCVSIGHYYDNDGFPSSTIRERLNGLLDVLGYQEIIPMGVRIFLDKLEGLCYVGKGDNKVAVGKNFASSIMVKPDPDTLSIDWTDLAVEAYNA